MSLLGIVAAELRRRGVAFAVVGAGALAVHGIVRGTRDVDLLALDAGCLDDATWAWLRASGCDVDIRRGDVDDPLAGVVRALRSDGEQVDVLVGRSPWQAGVLERAAPHTVADARVPVASRADLVLLKLYAGGPQDAWDVAALLADDEGSTVAREVEQRLPALPPECRALWARIRASGTEVTG